MAQDFRNVLVRTIGTSDTTLLAGGNYDAVIGIRCCNILTSTIAVDVKIEKGGADYFLAKGVSIPPNSAIELIVRSPLFCFLSSANPRSPHRNVE